MKIAQIYNATIEDLPSGNYHISCDGQDGSLAWSKTVTPKELLQFTQELAEMQGYVLLPKSNENNEVPLMGGWYVRNGDLDSPLGWFPTEKEAHEKDRVNPCSGMAHMCELMENSNLTPEDFIQFREDYYKNNPQS